MPKACDISDEDFTCWQSLWRHMKTHKKKYGEGLWTQKVNEQLTKGYGLKAKYDLDEGKYGKRVDNEDNIGKYVCKRNDGSCAVDYSVDDTSGGDSDCEDGVSESDSDCEDCYSGGEGDYDLDDTVKDDSDDCEDESDDISKGDDIGKYAVKERKETNKKHSLLLPQDIRAIVVGKS